MKATLRQMREKRARGEHGFTLIELLVVVVIIGVLVAIAVPVYLNYRQGAADKAAQSDVRGTITAVESFYTKNSNTYPDDATSQTGNFNLTATGATGEPVTLSDGTTLTYNKIDASTYVICAVNEGGETNYYYSNAAGGSVTSVAGKTPTACT